MLETYQDYGIEEKHEYLRLTKMMALKRNMEYLRKFPHPVSPIL